MTKTCLFSMFHLVCATIAGLLVASPAAAQSMRCQSKIIAAGETSAILEQECGAPDFVTTRRIANTTSAVGTEQAGTTTRVFETLETWIYRGKSGRMARFVEVRRGKVASIRVVSVPTVDDPVACQRVLEIGASSLAKVRLVCGGPADASRWAEERTITRDGLERSELISHERWVYDLGPGRFLRILTFENGSLASIETGRRQSE